MSTKKARKTKKQLRKPKKLEATKPLSLKFGASNPADVGGKGLS